MPGQSVKSIQNETTNLKTILFRLDKETQKEKFQPGRLVLALSSCQTLLPTF
jgi:hypothetical protein